LVNGTFFVKFLVSFWALKLFPSYSGISSCTNSKRRKSMIFWRPPGTLFERKLPTAFIYTMNVVQVYGASTWGWRGWFAIHTWIATKPTDAESYTVYEVIGWRQHRGLPAMRIEKDLPELSQV
jgi:hypothetical protein